MEGVQFRDHAREADASVAPGDLTDSPLRAGEALGRNAKRAVRQQPVAEELARLDRGNGTLLLVDLKTQLSLEELGHRDPRVAPRFAPRFPAFSDRR